MSFENQFKRLFLACIASAAIACAQPGMPISPSQPGQLISMANQMNAIPAVPDFAPAINAVRPAIPANDGHERLVKHLWIASILTMAAATSTDAATSWGYREANGVLASADGRFGAKGIGIKAGVISGVLVPQILLRHRTNLRTMFTIGNFVEAGIFSAAAIHNVRVAGLQ